MAQRDKTRFPAGSEIIFVTLPFTIFITGNLSYYADVLGMPNSTSYWCSWCLISHAEWNQLPETFHAEERSSLFLSEMPLAVKNDSEKRLKPTDRKGVTCERHYKCLGTQNFVPPLLHLEIGMVNQAWEDFEKWVDDVVEVVPPAEKDARKEVIDSRKNLAMAMDKKKETDVTINIEIREKSGEANVIKAEL